MNTSLCLEQTCNGSVSYPGRVKKILICLTLQKPEISAGSMLSQLYGQYKYVYHDSTKKFLQTCGTVRVNGGGGLGFVFMTGNWPFISDVGTTPSGTPLL